MAWTDPIKNTWSGLKKVGGWFADNSTSLFGGAGSIASAFMSYQAAKKLMDRQNKFTEYMSNTAHQREVKDLREAGLNPLLSAMGGSGATTPASGSGGSMSFENPMNSALAWRQQKNENKLADTNAELNSANAFKARKDASLAGEMARNEAEKFDLYNLQKEQVAQDIKNSIKLTDSQVYSNIHSANAAMESAKTKTPYQYSGKYLDDLFKSIRKYIDDPRNSTWSKPIYNHFYK